MQSNNPALNKMLGGAAQEQRMAPEYGHYGQQAAPPQVRPMTIDDVVVRTIGMLLLTGVAGAISWSQVEPNPSLAYGLMAIGGIVGLGVILVSWFSSISNPWIVGVYAAAQGLFLGVLSAMYESMWNGIVLQAVAATFGVFLTMALLFKARVLRNSRKFTKFMIGTGVGIMAMMGINFVMMLFGLDMGLFNRDPSSEVTPLQWIIAIGLVAWGAFSFILDFDMVERGVRYGLPKKYAWACTFGLVAGVIFLYWSILQLLGYANR